MQITMIVVRVKYFLMTVYARIICETKPMDSKKKLVNALNVSNAS